MKIVLILLLLMFKVSFCLAITDEETPTKKQLAPVSKTPVTHPKLLFKTNFGEGVSLGNIRNYSSGGAWQDLIGPDKETGFSFPVKALQADFTGIQLITFDKADPTTITKNMETSIHKVAGPNGKMVNELMHNVLIKSIGLAPSGKGHVQAPFMIKRSHKSGDLTDLYISYWYKFQKNLSEKLDPKISSANWRMLFEFKTGGYLDSWKGDYRFSIGIIKEADNKLVWRLKGDNGANGPWPKVEYWEEKNTSILIPLDQWFLFEVYWHRSKSDDGRFWTAINGQVLLDHKGKNMGIKDLPINRIMVANPYSGGSAPVESHITQVEIWDGFPCGDGKSCFK